MSWLIEAPLTLIGLIILALLLAGMEIGYRCHGWLQKRNDGDEIATPDYLLSAMLGLLALLLGFTFSMALNRYESRRELVVQEANAIGTTWLRAQLVEGPGRDRMSQSLRRYVDARLVWSNDPSPVPSMAVTSDLQRQLWIEMRATLRAEPSTQLSRGLMDAMNESFDLASARFAARNAHIPGEVLTALLLCSVLSAMMLGYMMVGAGRRHRAATIVLLLLVGLVMLVIFDLDRPASGMIEVSQQPLIDLRASIQP